MTRLSSTLPLLSRSLVACALAGLCSPQTAISIQVTNGDFSSGTEGWSLVAGGGRYFTEPFDDPVDYPHDPTTNPFFTDPEYDLISTPNWTAGFEERSALRLLSVQSDVPEYQFDDPEGQSWDFAPAFYFFGLQQQIDIEAGQVLSGLASFQSQDLPPYDYDRAVVMLGGTVLWEKGVLDLPEPGDEPDFMLPPIEEIAWDDWSWVAPDSGSFNLSLLVFGDDQEHSYGAFTSISIDDAPASSVPETARAPLLAGALALIVALKRRFAHTA